ncbi:HAUS augmin-like complex subunit 4 [Saccostrea echinata]|uniref:HAUS augmin-like complex subunit 4 n=1 Tax=Saccostrea echinata TaxID=191078 RepID=UPI002A81917A|nr:HAUS augmin-like complex subunit 4 [Saccostrea echinata]
MSTQSGLSEKAAERLNSSLPVDITAAQVQQYPELVKLLTQLSQRITPEGTSLHVKQELEQAEEELRHEKHSWLLQHILYKEIEEFLVDLELKSKDVSQSPDDKQFQAMLQECLTLSEIEDYLRCSPDPSCKVNLLGLTAGSIHTQNPHTKNLSYLQQKLIPQIEERLGARCENLQNFQETENILDGSPSLAKSSQLPALMESQKRKLEEDKHQLERLYIVREKQFQTYYQTLLDSLHLLEELISKYRLQSQAEHDTVSSEWLVAKCDGLCLKIKLVELQILCDTYTMETTKALLKIKETLHSAKEEADKSKTYVTKTLQTYESLGSEFDELVTEYQRLKEEIDNKEWALSELQKSDS